MKLTEAGQSEILRASQRDAIFKEQLTEKVSELLQLIGGIHVWIKYKDVAKILGNLLYEMVTTMLNLQTLGEEYTGLVQVNSTGTSLPKKYFLMILLNNCGENIFMDCLKKLENKVKILPEDHPLQPSARRELAKILTTLRTFIPILEKAHKALFFFNGRYYEIAKRLCGIRYVLLRYWLKDISSLPTFKFLGIISLVPIIVKSILTIKNLKNIQAETESPSIQVNKPNKSSTKCPLCLNFRKDTSVTPCGHLFCWTCIIQWLHEQAKCPICRFEFQPSRVVFLQNF